VKRGAEDLMSDSDVSGEGKRKREGEELERLREENDRLSAENTKLRIELEEMRRNVDGLRNGVTAAERCGCCLALESKAKRYARDNRDLTLGEQVIRNPLIRDQTLKHLNPFKLSDLQTGIRAGSARVLQAASGRRPEGMLLRGRLGTDGPSSIPRHGLARYLF